MYTHIRCLILRFFSTLQHVKGFGVGGFFDAVKVAPEEEGRDLLWMVALLAGLTDLAAAFVVIPVMQRTLKVSQLLVVQGGEGSEGTQGKKGKKGKKGKVEKMGKKGKTGMKGTKGKKGKAAEEEEETNSTQRPNGSVSWRDLRGALGFFVLFSLSLIGLVNYAFALFAGMVRSPLRPFAASPVSRPIDVLMR